MSCFGEKLRELRNMHHPPVTQEALAIKIGKSKMLISSFENRKNAPPQDDLLSEIIEALSLSEEQANELRFLASCERGEIPGDIASYCYMNPTIFNVIRIAMRRRVDDDFWNRVIRMMEGNSDV